MNDTQKDLLSLVANALFSIETDVKINDEIREEAKKQAVWGLIDSKALAVFANNARVQYSHALLSRCMGDIPFTTIKGYASAYYYPVPIRRTMGDVDFLIDGKNLDEAEKKLLAEGFVPDHETSLHRCYRKGNILFEMHARVNGIPDNDAAVIQLLSDTIGTARRIHSNDGDIIIPDDFHNGLICLLHIISHMRNTGIGLRHFCDWACFVNAVNGFEEVFKERFESIGLWNCAKIFALTAVKYIGMPYKKWMGEADEAVKDLLMDEVLISGNFGRNREVQEANWFINKKGGKSSIAGFFTTLNGVIKNEWSIVEKVPLLYIAGWIYFPMRYFIRILLGKRKKINLTSAIKQADDKNKLINKLELFVK